MDIPNKVEKSSEENNTQSHMEPVFELMDSGLNEDGTKFDPKADEEEYFNEWTMLSIIRKLLRV